MPRVAILTIFDQSNVGNRLQNFALVRVLEDLGHDVSVLENYPYPACDDPRLGARAPFVAQAPRRPARGSRADDLFWALKRRLSPRAKAVPALVRARVRRDVQAARHALAVAARRQELTRFTQETMTVPPTVYRRPEHLDSLRDEYDYFVVGSDQVWNYVNRLGCPMDFLRFATPHQRVAYAASIGRDSLAEYEELYGAMLSDFVKVSVREEQAAVLVEQVTGREAPVVLDPTLLVHGDTWSGIADRAAPQVDGDYAASYLLYHRDGETLASVETRAAAEGLTLHDMLVPEEPMVPRSGAEAFLRSIRDARYVVTDSFHATVFSILLATPVVVLPRDDGQNSRLETLLETVGVARRTAFGLAGDVPSSPLVPDPSAALRDARAASMTWLARALDSQWKGEVG